MTNSNNINSSAGVLIPIVHRCPLFEVISLLKGMSLKTLFVTLLTLKRLEKKIINKKDKQF